VLFAVLHITEEGYYLLLSDKFHFTRLNSVVNLRRKRLPGHGPSSVTFVTFSLICLIHLYAGGDPKHVQTKHPPFLPTDLPGTTFWRLEWDLWAESFSMEELGGSSQERWPCMVSAW